MGNFTLQKGPCSFLNLHMSPWEVLFSLSSLFLFSLYLIPPIASPFFCPRAAHPFLPSSLPLLGCRSGGALGASSLAGAAAGGVSTRAAVADPSSGRRASAWPRAMQACAGGVGQERGRLGRCRWTRSARDVGAGGARAALEARLVARAREWLGAGGPAWIHGARCWGKAGAQRSGSGGAGGSRRRAWR
jgi:hypothetical protein